MAENPNTGAEIKPTDIPFNCPHCGKSLVIDYRGAGLTIPCSDCGESVVVPIPEGMELSDVDLTDEDRVLRLMNLRKSIALAEGRNRDLEEQVRKLTQERDALAKSKTDAMYQFAGLLEKVGLVQKSLKDATQALESLSKAAETTTRKA